MPRTTHSPYKTVSRGPWVVCAAIAPSASASVPTVPVAEIRTCGRKLRLCECANGKCNDAFRAAGRLARDAFGFGTGGVHTWIIRGQRLKNCVGKGHIPPGVFISSSFERLNVLSRHVDEHIRSSMDRDGRPCLSHRSVCRTITHSRRISVSRMAPRFCPSLPTKKRHRLRHVRGYRLRFQLYVCTSISLPLTVAPVSTGSLSSRIPLLYSAVMSSSSILFRNRNRR